MKKHLMEMGNHGKMCLEADSSNKGMREISKTGIFRKEKGL